MYVLTGTVSQVRNVALGCLTLVYTYPLIIYLLGGGGGVLIEEVTMIIKHCKLLYYEALLYYTVCIFSLFLKLLLTNTCLYVCIHEQLSS